MENPEAGTKYASVKKSFKLAVHSLLTTLSKEDFCKVFSGCSADEQERLHRLFLKVIMSLHRNIEDEFKNICDEHQVEAILHTVENLVEEQSLNPLSLYKTDVPNVAHDMRTAKVNEIQHLQGILEKADKQNQLLRERIEHLKKDKQDSSGIEDALSKMKSLLNYGSEMK